jgi:hypothetical protein
MMSRGENPSIYLHYFEYTNAGRVKRIIEVAETQEELLKRATNCSKDP